MEASTWFIDEISELHSQSDIIYYRWIFDSQVSDETFDKNMTKQWRWIPFQFAITCVNKLVCSSKSLVVF